MDLKRLKHLVALADTRNFGRAAVQCHLTQSRVQPQHPAAEEELGLLLFDRGTVEATCTDAGAFVVKGAGTEAAVREPLPWARRQPVPRAPDWGPRLWRRPTLPPR